MELVHIYEYWFYVSSISKEILADLMSYVTEILLDEFNKVRKIRYIIQQTAQNCYSSGRHHYMQMLMTFMWDKDHININQMTLSKN